MDGRDLSGYDPAHLPMADNPKRLLVPLPLGQALLAYLNNRPYGEVAKLVQELASCQAVDVRPAPAEPAPREETPDETRRRVAREDAAQPPPVIR